MDTNAVNAILEVTSQDIAYFRRGELSPAVRTKLETAERGCNRWLYIILIACIAIIMAVFVLAKGNWETIIAVSAVPAVFGIGSLLLLLFARTPMTSPEGMKVYTASGPARISVSVDDGSKRYILLVEKADFSLDRSLFEAIPDGANIKVYYQKFGNHNKLLGVESNE